MIGLDWHGGGTIPQERAGAITFKGNPRTLTGPEVSVGKKAPEFTEVATDLSKA